MITPQIGQRWMVDTDSSLGLGIVVECDARTLTIDFPAVDESRCYSKDNAPLTRVIFAVGDKVETVEQTTFQVAQLELINDLVIYLTAEGEPIPETRLAAYVELNHPVKRLLAGQLDKPKWFDLRAELAEGYHRWLCSPIAGLQGARIGLTPHQLYVAESASRLNRTRVLLADEVGLGKTIEAGLILQRLLLQERVQRVLIVVPSALQVQWFVELVRCFNIRALLWSKELGGEAGDLEDSRIFIASHNSLEDTVSLTTNDRDIESVDAVDPLECSENVTHIDHSHTNALTQTPWDMVIVDEAHHFDLLSDSLAATTLLALGKATKHLLLLSATPERMGLEQHFSRLQLLDPSRFYNFSAFKKQYENYEMLADDLMRLLDSETVTPDLQEKLLHQFPQLSKAQAPEFLKNKNHLMSFLLDCHGTGRVVFRNTRSAIKGFPERQLHVHKVDQAEGENLVWLTQFVKQHVEQKSLFITRSKDDVLVIKEYLYRKTGIDCPVFHEGMSLVERDRAAAYFADQDEGAPLLLCSEIGSEGRNFQFCHHLICWDLPEHPDVLEQRIGRLDRIGQKNTIHIHVCINGAIAESRLVWYHEILNCIEKTNPAAGIMHDQWYTQYQDNPNAVGETVKKQTQEWLAQLQNGRDRLLEMNSCRQPDADRLLDTVVDFEKNKSPQTLFTQANHLLNIHKEAID